MRVRRCRSFEEARALLGRELADAVVVGTAAGWLEGAAVLVADFPGIPVLAYGRFGPDDGALLVASRAHGIGAVLVEGVDEPVAGEVLAAHTAGRRRLRQLADGPRLLRLTEPIQRAAWDEALASDVPVVLEFKTDPEVPPLPPHITLKHAKAFASTLLKGDPDEFKVIAKSMRQLARELLP